MATLYTHQSQNKQKSWLLMFLFVGIVVGVGWFLSWHFDMQFILYIAIGIALIQAAVAYWSSDKIALKSAGAQQITKDDYPELWRTTENLAITAGLPMPRLYVIEDPAPNAFATGRNPEHAAIAVTTGLLNRLDKSELEGVLAHELSHVGNRDILVMSLTVVLIGFLALVSDIFLRLSIFGFGGRDGEGGGNVVSLVISIALMLLAPIAGLLIKAAISRKREYTADASGALLTRYPEGLASALEKISSYEGKGMERASDATAHLFISNPFGKRAKKGIKKLFATHPPIEKRIEKLRNQ